MWIGWGYDETVDISGGHRKTGLFLEVLNILWLFLKVKIQNWNIIGDLLTFNDFWVMPDFGGGGGGGGG